MLNFIVKGEKLKLITLEALTVFLEDLIKNKKNIKWK